MGRKKQKRKTVLLTIFPKVVHINITLMTTILVLAGKPASQLIAIVLLQSQQPHCVIQTITSICVLTTESSE